MNLNEFAKEVHALAVEKGFYDPQPTDAELIAAIHSEISEAFEAWRDGEPMVWHACTSEEQAVPCESLPMCVNKQGGRIRVKGKRKDRDICNYRDPKPLGIAVELIDVALRVLDAAAAWNLTLNPSDIEESVKLGRKYGADALNFPQLVVGLHYAVAMAHTIETVQNCTNWLSSSLCGVLTWLDVNGVDPEALMLEKHEYNKTRPYRHGGKRI